jgi:hypothetical protein
VAGLALIANIVLIDLAGAAQWCEPRTSEEAYDAIQKAAPEGSDLDVESQELADDRRADGEFDTEETREDLHDLAVEHEYLFDCAARAYIYAPEETSDSDPGDFDADDDSDDSDDADEDGEDAADDAEDEDDEAGDEDADDEDADEDDDAPAASSPTTAPAPRAVSPTTRPAPARTTTPAPAPAYRPAPSAPAVSSAGSGSSAYSYDYSYPNKWAPTATTAPRSLSGQTQITSAPLVKSLPNPAAVSSGTETTRRVANGADRRLFLVPAAIGIALGVECMKRWLQRRRRF